MQWTLARLIRALARVDGLERIRFTTSHLPPPPPNDMEDDLIAAHGDEPKLMPYLHLPVQSGKRSLGILKAMNRKHTAEATLRLIDPAARGARPICCCQVILSSSFPGETWAGFRRYRWAWCVRLLWKPISFLIFPPSGTLRAGTRCSDVWLADSCPFAGDSATCTPRPKMPWWGAECPVLFRIAWAFWGSLSGIRISCRTRCM